MRCNRVMTSSSVAGSLIGLFPVLVLCGPTATVLLVCRYLNRRDERQAGRASSATEVSGVAQLLGERVADVTAAGAWPGVVQSGRRS